MSTEDAETTLYKQKRDEIVERAQITLPSHMQRGATDYVLFGQIPSSYLYEVLCNRLYQSLTKADTINRACILTWAEWLESLPHGCWGNPDNVRDWMARGGLYGLLIKEGGNNE
jgi:hypothetical protein